MVGFPCGIGAFLAGRVWAFFMWFVFKSVYGIDEPKDDVRKP